MSTTEPERDLSYCRWCEGTGSVDNALAYVPGGTPFAGPAQTVLRLGMCKHCRGTGEYDSAQDPTLPSAHPGADPA